MSGFEQSQQSYYLREINRAIPVTSSKTADLRTIQAALGVVDPAMPEDTRPLTDAVQFMSTFGRQTDALTRDAECRILPMPGDAMRADPAARTGCGWWYVPDAGSPSVGAYGTRRGPMNPRLDTQFGTGQWIWEPREAQRLEELKRAARVTDCASMSASPIADRLAWCADTGMAVVVNADGSPRYPTAPGGDCPTAPTRTCPVLPGPGAAGGGAGGAGGGASGICAPQAGGALSPACIQSRVTNTCSNRGALYMALNNGSYAGTNTNFNTLNTYVASVAGAPAGVIGPAAMSTTDVDNYTAALARAAVDTSTRVGLAASALCYDGSVDPCKMLSPSDPPPFPAECITRAATGKGYATDAGIMPSQIGMDYWNGPGQGTVGGNWQNVLTTLDWWKQTADTPPAPGTQNNQPAGLWNVYGVSVQYPRTGPNYTGMYIYRYYYNTGSPQSFFNGTNGPNTHFLGRYLIKQKDLFFNNVASSQQIMPAGSTNLEVQRFVTVYRPTTGGNYTFLITYDDSMRFTLADSTGAPLITTDWRMNTGETYTTGAASLIADQEYTITLDMTNAADMWSLRVQAMVNGTGPYDIDGTQLFLPYDRRQPMVNLSFNKMPTNLAAPDAVTDTNGVFQNLALVGNASIGTLGGIQCMLVNANPNGSGVYNFRNVAQGIRGRAFKSMTLMINVTNYNYSPDGTLPSLISFYNVNSVDPTEQVPHRAPAPSWNYGNRSQDMSLFMSTGGAIFQYKDARDPSILLQYFYNVVPLSVNAWHHIAIVWDDDFQGYAFFLDGALKGQLRATGPGVSQLFEQIRIGCDATDDGARWSGGIAWFRAFDYRLSTERIQTDMNDAWANLQ